MSDIAEMIERRRVAFQHVMNSAHPSPDQVRLAFDGRFPEQFRSGCIFDPQEVRTPVVEPHQPWPQPPSSRRDFVLPCGVDAKHDYDAKERQLTVTEPACGTRSLDLVSIGFTRGILDGGHLPGVAEEQLVPALQAGKAVLVTYNDATAGLRPEVTAERARQLAEIIQREAAASLGGQVGIKYEARAHYEPHCPNQLYRFYLFPLRDCSPDQKRTDQLKGPETGVVTSSQNRITQSAQFVGLVWTGSKD